MLASPAAPSGGDEPKMARHPSQHGHAGRRSEPVQQCFVLAGGNNAMCAGYVRIRVTCSRVTRRQRSRCSPALSYSRGVARKGAVGQEGTREAEKVALRKTKAEPGTGREGAPPATGSPLEHLLAQPPRQARHRGLAVPHPSHTATICSRDAELLEPLQHPAIPPPDRLHHPPRRSQTGPS
jgi:hypothetical protein